MVAEAHALAALTVDLVEMEKRCGLCGCRRSTAFLRDAGWAVKHKRVAWMLSLSDVIDVLADLVIVRATPAHIRSDHGGRWWPRR